MARCGCLQVGSQMAQDLLSLQTWQAKQTRTSCSVVRRIGLGPGCGSLCVQQGCFGTARILAIHVLLAVTARFPGRRCHLQSCMWCLNLNQTHASAVLVSTYQEASVIGFCLNRVQLAHTVQLQVLLHQFCAPRITTAPLHLRSPLHAPTACRPMRALGVWMTAVSCKHH